MFNCPPYPNARSLSEIPKLRQWYIEPLIAVVLMIEYIKCNSDNRSKLHRTRKVQVNQYRIIIFYVHTQWWSYALAEYVYIYAQFTLYIDNDIDYFDDN